MASKRAAELLDKAGEKGRTTFIGEFLLYATLTCFYNTLDDSSDISMSSSMHINTDNGEDDKNGDFNPNGPGNTF